MEQEELNLAGLKQVQLAAVREIMRATTAALPLEEILPLIANVTIIAFDALTAWVMLAEDGTLRTVIARGERAAQLTGVAGSLHSASAGTAVSSVSPTIVLPRDIAPGDPVLGPLAQTSEPVVLVPIRVNDEVRGLLGATVNMEATQDIGFLVTLAEQAAVALEDARLRAELHMWRRRLDAVVEQMHDPLLVYEQSGTLVLMNSVARQWLQASGVHVGDSLADVARKVGMRDEWGNAVQLAETAAARALHGEIVENLEEQIILGADQAPRYVLANAAPLHIDHQVDGAVVVLRDISTRKQLEETLRVSEGRYRRVVETASEGIWIIDDTSRTTYVNKRMAELLGYAEDEMLGRSSFEFIFPSDYVAASRQFEQRQQGFSGQSEWRLRRKDGTPIWLQSSTSVIHDDDGTFLGVLGMFADISERKQAEAERAQLLEREQAALAEAREAVRLRDAFLSIASHEFKNPLTVLLGQAHLLQHRAERDGTLSPRDRKALTAIAEQAHRLNTLITKMLDLSQLEQGQLTIAHSPLKLCRLVERIVASVEPTLERHTLVCTLPATPIIITGDALRLDQVFHNLIRNAVKYSPQGGTIAIEVSRAADIAQVVIRDHGIGIPADALPHLFQRFYRADNVIGRTSGTGIGLYIVKELVTLHGGSIEVRSREGEGSSFTVRLPCALEESALGEGSEG